MADRTANVNLEGETALVVGGTRNIGLAVAQALQGAGAKACVVGGSDSAALANALTELGAAEGKSTGPVADPPGRASCPRLGTTVRPAARRPRR